MRSHMIPLLQSVNLQTSLILKIQALVPYLWWDVNYKKNRMKNVFRNSCLTHFYMTILEWFVGVDIIAAQQILIDFVERV